MFFEMLFWGRVAWMGDAAGEQGGPLVIAVGPKPSRITFGLCELCVGHCELFSALANYVSVLAIVFSGPCGLVFGPCEPLFRF